MPKFFIKENQIKSTYVEIINEDNHHIKSVLRKKIGDEILVCDSKNMINYLCQISEFSNDKTICSIKEKIINDSNIDEKIKISIFQGLPKSDKMELIIQKSVELGVYDITPVFLERCVVKIVEKEQPKKISRWQKISEVAAKQSGRNIIPSINNILNIKSLTQKIQEYDLFLVAYENEKDNRLKDEIANIKIELLKKDIDIKIGILIGPEGGISENEILALKESRAKVITLGNRILRTETVALNVISILMYEFEN